MRIPHYTSLHIIKQLKWSHSTVTQLEAQVWVTPPLQVTSSHFTIGIHGDWADRSCASSVLDSLAAISANQQVHQLQAKVPWYLGNLEASIPGMSCKKSATANSSCVLWFFMRNLVSIEDAKWILCWTTMNVLIERMYCSPQSLLWHECDPTCPSNPSIFLLRQGFSRGSKNLPPTGHW